MVRNYTLFFVMLLAVINCGVMGMESSEESSLFDLSFDTNPIPLSFDTNSSPLSCIFEGSGQQFQNIRTQEPSFVTPNNIIDQTIPLLDKMAKADEKKLTLNLYKDYNTKHDTIVKDKKRLSVLIGREALFVHAIKNQEIEFIVSAMKDTMLQSNPFVELLGPVYSNKACHIWVPEQLISQVPYKDMAETARLLASKGNNKQFLVAYEKEMEDQKNRRKSNLPVYKISN